MWKVYFGELGEGRLKRLPYLGYHILLMVLVFAIMFGVIFMAGSLGNMISGNIMQMQTAFLEKFGIVTLFGFIFFFFAVMFAQVNLLVKRIRDMGLPALWTILGLIVLSILLNLLFPAQHMEMSTAVVSTSEGTNAAISANASSGSVVVKLFDTIVFLCLVLIPSDTFKK